MSDFRISDLPVMTIGTTAKMDETVFFDLMDREIKPMPERIPGVGNVNLTGGQEREIQINLNGERMSAYNLSILEVCQTLLTSNLDFPTGKIKNGNEQILIRMQGKYQTMADIENLAAGGRAVQQPGIAICNHRR